MRSRFKFLLFFLLLFLVLLINAFYASYPDEFDNILGGKLILQGVLPYVGFFSHHGALGYFLSAILVLFGGISFVHFRILSALFFTALFGVSAYFLKRRVPEFKPTYFLTFLGMLAIAATYFWGQMFLADVVSGYFLILPYSLLLLKTYYQKPLVTADLWLISIFTGLAVLTSTTYLYVALVIGVITVLFNWRQFFKVAIIFATPYLVFVSYLVVTRSLSDFFYQAVYYNQHYYISNYPWAPGATFFNPLRYAIVIFTNFFGKFHPAVSGIATANLQFPMTHFLALANLTTWVWLGIRKKYLALLLSTGLAIFVNARGNPAEIRPSDYQTGVYLILSLLNVFLVLSFLKAELSGMKDHLSRSLMTFLGVALLVFTFFGGMFLFSEFWRNVDNRYMGAYPLIYDRPLVAPIVNSIIPANRYCWVGPFEFEEMFYLKCKAPSKYHWLLPQFANIDKIKQEIVAQNTANLPDVIVYRRDYSAFGAGAEFSNFYVDFLNDKYLRIYDVPPKKAFYFVSPKKGDFNFDEDFNFEKSKATGLVQKLVEQGIVAKR